jgi:glutaconate CoA-transferase subunit A
MTDKLVSLADAARLVPDGAVISIGGVLLNRVPAAFVRELVRQGRRRLTLYKPSPSYDVDLLAAAGALDTVGMGMATFETRFGQAMNFRRAVEAGDVRVIEHS